MSSRRKWHGVALVAVLSILCVALGWTRIKQFAYAGPGRDGWQQPERVVRELGLRMGDRVADLGAGGGYFTFRLAEAVGPEGHVYAVDVDDGMLEDLDRRIREEGHANVSTVRAAYDDPELPEPGVDLIFISNTYHHIEDRTTYWERARGYLRPGGRVAIVEYEEGGGWFQRLFGHATAPESIESEMRTAGYRLLAEHDFLERQSFFIFGPSRLFGARGG